MLKCTVDKDWKIKFRREFIANFVKEGDDGRNKGT